MHSFKELSELFSGHLSSFRFPAQPVSLYDPCAYFLNLGGKRIRPVLCLMAAELFAELSDDAFHAATAIELFHNFTLVHDDIMDNAALRRGNETVHHKYGMNTAILSGDVIMIEAYQHLSKVSTKNIAPLLAAFNTTARQVCEGQQLDMDFEKQNRIRLEDYIHMVALKTSVLLACSLQMGAITGGAGAGNCEHLYNFGKNLGIAFQIQDDYLDAFGEKEKTGKEVGGDIRQNKKTFLLLHAMEKASHQQQSELNELLATNAPDKIEKVLNIYRDCKADKWALDLKNQYLEKAMHHLEKVAVVSSRKMPLYEVSEFLVKRDY